MFFDCLGNISAAAKCVNKSINSEYVLQFSHLAKIQATHINFSRNVKRVPCPNNCVHKWLIS